VKVERVIVSVKVERVIVSVKVERVIVSVKVRFCRVFFVIILLCSRNKHTQVIHSINIH